MLHHTSIPWSPERTRRLIFSLICSSDKAANVPKPTSVGITSSQTRTAFVLRACHQLPRRHRAAECGQQFPSSDGDCHTPLPCEVRRRKNTTPRACCP